MLPHWLHHVAIKFKLIKIKYFLSHISHIYMLNSHMWLVVTILDNTNTEHFHYFRRHH